MEEGVRDGLQVGPGTGTSGTSSGILRDLGAKTVLWRYPLLYRRWRRGVCVELLTRMLVSVLGTCLAGQMLGCRVGIQGCLYEYVSYTRYWEVDLLVRTISDAVVRFEDLQQ